jgi:dienelactone hydrolase
MKAPGRALGFLLLSWACAANATMTQLPGLVREPFQLDVTMPDGTHAELEALLTRPDKPERFPLAIINHGLPRDVMAIVKGAPENYSGTAIVFAQHGYAAAVVNRRGYGMSSGSLEGDFGPCSDRDYPRAGHAWAAEILASVAGLKTEPWADPDHVLLVGHSAGGFAALAAAAGDPAGIVGIVDFAGGLGSPTADFVCQPERLIQTMHGFGENAHVPSLWIFAENDHSFGPHLARQMFDAYTAGGAPAEFDAAPSFGRDGHFLIFAASPAPWWPRVATFLDHLHLPVRTVVDLPPPSALPVPPGLDARGNEDFASYVTSRSYEKAFATDGKGHYARVFGQRTQEDAQSAALKRCEQRDWTCSIYALGNELVGIGAADAAASAARP